MPTLFDPLRLGDLELPNRVVMAPLTRLRAGPTQIPNALMADYYARILKAGLLHGSARNGATVARRNEYDHVAALATLVLGVGGVSASSAPVTWSFDVSFDSAATAVNGV